MTPGNPTSLTGKCMNGAFTLIELLIVVAIIAILAAIAVPNFLEAQTRAKISRVKADNRTVATGLMTYMVDHQKFPIDHHVNPPGAYQLNRITLLTTPISYLSSIPVDPFHPTPNAVLNHAGYQYFNFRENWGNQIVQYYPAGSVEQTKAAMIKGLGPDRKDEGAEWLILGKDWPYGSTKGISRFYDPTNGTISIGDTVRIVGDTKGMPEQM